MDLKQNQAKELAQVKSYLTDWIDQQNKIRKKELDYD